MKFFVSARWKSLQSTSDVPSIWHTSQGRDKLEDNASPCLQSVTDAPNRVVTRTVALVDFILVKTAIHTVIKDTNNLR